MTFLLAVGSAVVLTSAEIVHRITGSRVAILVGSATVLAFCSICIIRSIKLLIGGF
jgi:hypothetical protein